MPPDAGQPLVVFAELASVDQIRGAADADASLGLEREGGGENDGQWSVADTVLLRV